jgi:broad specificity phosphatase PhoE
MGTLYLVRHGQASFGTDNYDQLSPLGEQQSRRLGEHFKDQGLRFEAVYMGTLKRHRQTWEGIAQGMGVTDQASEQSGLDEYDSEAVLAAIGYNLALRHASPAPQQQHFRALRDGLRQWMAGVVSPRGMPAYVDFVDGVMRPIRCMQREHSGDVLVVSSGGPIATAVGEVLGISPETTIELNLRMRNTSVTELQARPRRLALVAFNALPHLSNPAHKTWLTHV